LHAAKILVVVFITILTPSLHAKEPFGFDSVADRAKKLAAEPFRAPPSIPEFLTRLSYDEYRDIRFDTKRSLRRERGNFQVQFIHPGLYYNYAVGIHVVENEVRKLDFSPNLFTYGRNKFGDKIPAFCGISDRFPFA
jgi:periplasmic glucans biosynthesis protein